jgi:hypothetical protein
MKIWELFDQETKWTKGSYGRCVGRLGTLLSCGSKDEDACCWCLAGAINKCYPGGKTEHGNVYVLLADAISEKTGHQSDRLAHDIIVSWNDAPSRTFQEVYDLVKELDV